MRGQRQTKVRRIDMGATGRNYFTPYQADIAAALQALRAEVFERGEYGQAGGMSPEALANLPPEVRKAFENLRELEAQRLGGPSEFDSIDELLEAAAEDGTHSISARGRRSGRFGQFRVAIGNLLWS
jgi:hypothetical protein